MPINRNNSSLIPVPSSHEEDVEAQTLDPSNAVRITLPPAFELSNGYAPMWPEGFWPIVNTADSHYQKGRYLQAKELYLKARKLLQGYERLDTSIIRTYRKLYKAAIEKNNFVDALNELSEFIRDFPGYATDMDKKQYNKVVESIKREKPDHPAKAILLKEQRRNNYEVPMPQVESSPGVAIAVKLDPDWKPVKGEKRCFWRDRKKTSIGYITLYPIYDKPAGRFLSCKIRVYSPTAEIVSERDWLYSFHHTDISPSGKYLLGFSEDLHLSLWTMEGSILADRNISSEVHGDKYHLRSLAVSADAGNCLFTVSIRAYLLDARLRIHRIWVMPPPPDYKVDRGEKSAPDERVLKALAVLELSGHPTQEEIKDHFRRMILLHHPDRHPDDPSAGERTREIIEACEVLSNEDVFSMVRSLGIERYYKVIHEVAIEIPEHLGSIKLSVQLSGSGDWIYASHITPGAERIYLGCYSGRVYCLDYQGGVQSVFTTNAPISGILERKEFLYIWTYTTLYVIRVKKVSCFIDLRDASVECFPDWGIVVRKKQGLHLYSEEGVSLGVVSFLNDPREIVPMQKGLVVKTIKGRYFISITH
jgi:tetratricopeptide (TPR) repeat protein